MHSWDRICQSVTCVPASRCKSLEGLYGAKPTTKILSTQPTMMRPINISIEEVNIVDIIRELLGHTLFNCNAGSESPLFSWNVITILQNCVIGWTRDVTGRTR